MKSVGLVLSLVLMCLASVVVAQSGGYKSVDKPAQSDAQKSFTLLKSSRARWEGPVTTVPKLPDMGDNTRTQATLRVTSRGNALVHELQ